MTQRVVRAAVSGLCLEVIGLSCARGAAEAKNKSVAHATGCRRQLRDMALPDRADGTPSCEEIEQPGSEVTLALLDALTHDANVNVRLGTRLSRGKDDRRGAGSA